MRRLQHGFTLFELMLVVTIIGILAAVAFPAYQDYVTRSRVSEALTLVEPVKKAVSDFYDRWGVFPENNRQAALPAPDSFIGNYVQSITVADGAIRIAMRHSTRLAGIGGKTLSLRPAFNTTYPTGPLAWVCGNSTMPQGLSIVGQKVDVRVSIEDKYLPAPCRALK